MEYLRKLYSKIIQNPDEIILYYYKFTGIIDH
jgi:hypothetical protein